MIILDILRSLFFLKNNLKRNFAFYVFLFSAANMNEKGLGFVALDYVVFAITVVISIGIGIFHAMTGGRQKTTSEYLVGNRKMSIVPVTLSLIVSFESSIMMLAYPAEVYTYGVMFVMSALGFTFASMLATRIVVPLIHPLKITSVNEVINH